ncbi:MAG TPA: winged helix-turn-helix domain-containing protein [Solirubrobacteraceae bacterium]|nr:winged helix-turn-helix domain-containing protein [Solirubrobacteraceae bacterium]
MPRKRHGAVPDETVSRARLDSLQVLAAQLAAPLSLQRIAAVVEQAAMDLLDAEIVAVAVHVDDRRHFRGVQIAGIPHDGHERLSAAPCDEASLVAEIDQLLGGHGAARGVGSLAVLRIQQVVCPAGLMLLGRLEPRPFSEVERTFATVLAGLCALALDRLRLSAERARARRRQDGTATAASHLRVGDMDIDLANHSVSMEGRVASLTASEMRLLGFLADQPGQARSRREILRHLWHTEHVGDERACDVHISNLRRKIERVPSRPERLITMRGYGYALMPR